MEHIDLIDRLVPKPASTIVVKRGPELYLVDTSRQPKESDTVLLPDDSLKSYDSSMNGSARGVAYCAIRFLGIASLCLL